MQRTNSPSVNITYYLKSAALAVDVMKILSDPSNKVILEDTFDELMEEIRCKQLMDVGTGKVMGKWLK
jgi:hypothetical protein